MNHTTRNWFYVRPKSGRPRQYPFPNIPAPNEPWDRRASERRDIWLSRVGGGDVLAGDGYDLLQHCYGWDFRTAKAAVEEWTGALPELGRPRRAPTERPAQVSTTQNYALSIWASVDRSDEAVVGRQYAQAKRIDWHAGAGRERASGSIVGQSADCLVVPIRELATGEVVAVQAINHAGAKQSFGPIRGHGFIIGNDLDRDQRWFVVEGFADAVAMFRNFRGTCVFASLGSGKVMDHLAERILEHYSPVDLVVLEDSK